ncbi:MAG: hypothetical protein OEY28_04405, partial [Nitrospira sp.]|nr:hypothetical protein [Nitrospira sp.]
MIRRNIVQAVIFLLAGLSFHAGPATAACQLELVSKNSAYGKFVDLALSAPADTGTDAVDLATLDKDFVLVHKTQQTSAATAEKTVFHLRLYPRRPGDVIIPGLACDGADTRPLTVNVAPAKDEREHTPIQVTTEVGDTEVWLKQAVRVVME